jgi:hypothetical protein
VNFLIYFSEFQFIKGAFCNKAPLTTWILLAVNQGISAKCIICQEIDLFWVMLAQFLLIFFDLDLNSTRNSVVSLLLLFVHLSEVCLILYID